MAAKRRNQRGGFFRRIKQLFVLLVLLLLAAAGGLYWYATTPQAQPVPLTFNVGPGSVKRIAEQLEKQGATDSALLFRVLARVSGKETKLKAGVYRIEAPIAPWALLDKLARGDVVEVVFTIVEGWNWRELRRALTAETQLQGDLATLDDAALLKTLKIDADSPEGQFFPDTYHVNPASSELALLGRAHARMQQKLDAAWAQRAPDLPLKTPQEALILASVIEKETGHGGDRPMIAGVFANRLKIGMRLQTDPTVIYGMGEAYAGKLRKIDLQTDTPYNTYTRAGLPPTPIAMTGEAALMAAVRPAATQALYFVSRGDGTSQFSASLEEHNSAVNRYIRGR
ncbi:lipoprotein [Jeongeupia sp. HS-3]|uniref:endolytic transglycosylase MltG n=1 Tax=Jeongeupia sp. HS-3 TaxID=1009682 RepID=UPI0018A3F228|nr:endolytic transglycosylase MltG [Jeongeupia sp. HS-3]BCL74581.1 lipoprotein [Jeongeupia sp. HS-3]